ncbi:MAG: recombinase family protein [Peptostreptococcaceae bacterium]|nr:recombinase family protein [Peptostreptococcaceae bacterium]
MNKVFNYIRVSTKEQNEERQIQAMNEFNKANGFDKAIQLVDKATGNNTNRKNLQLLLSIVGKGDLVVISSIDRLSRNYKEVVDLWNQITSSGADIVVLDMPLLDTRQYKDLLGDFISNLILQVLGYVAQQETEMRKKRQAEGIQAMPVNEQGKKVSKKTGRTMGRQKVDFPPAFQLEYSMWKAGQQTAVQTMKNLGLTKTTFYKLVKEYEENNILERK